MVRTRSFHRLAGFLAACGLPPAACVLYAPTDGFTGGAPPVPLADAGDARPSSDAPDATATYRALVLHDHPLAYWRFDETAATVARDETGHGYDATYVGSVVLGVPGALAGDPSPAARFDGTTAYAFVPDASKLAFTGTSPYSLEVWVRPRPAPNYRIILAKVIQDPTGQTGTGYVLSVLPETDAGVTPLVDGRVNGSDRGGFQTQGRVADGAWSHVVVTYASGTGLAYVNGAAAGQGSQPQTLPSIASDFTIAGEYAGTSLGGAGYPGDLDEMAVYDYAMTPDQIALHYHAGIGQAP